MVTATWMGLEEDTSREASEEVKAEATCSVMAARTAVANVDGWRIARC